MVEMSAKDAATAEDGPGAVAGGPRRSKRYNLKFAQEHKNRFREPYNEFLQGLVDLLPSLVAPVPMQPALNAMLVQSFHSAPKGTNWTVWISLDCRNKFLAAKASYSPGCTHSEFVEFLLQNADHVIANGEASLGPSGYVPSTTTATSSTAKASGQDHGPSSLGSSPNVPLAIVPSHAPVKSTNHFVSTAKDLSTAVDDAFGTNYRSAQQPASLTVQTSFSDIMNSSSSSNGSEYRALQPVSYQEMLLQPPVSHQISAPQQPLNGLVAEGTRGEKRYMPYQLPGQSQQKAQSQQQNQAVVKEPPYCYLHGVHHEH